MTDSIFGFADAFEGPKEVSEDFLRDLLILPEIAEPLS